MKKNIKIVVSAQFSDSLGMPIMKLKDMDGKNHSFQFLPSQFRQFADALSATADQAIPADLHTVQLLPELSDQQKEIFLKATQAAPRSQSNGYSVFANSDENVAFLLLRSSFGDQAMVPFDAESIDKLINYLLNARKQIDPSGSEVH